MYIVHPLQAMKGVACRMPAMVYPAVTADARATHVAVGTILFAVVPDIRVLVIVFVLNPDSVVEWLFPVQELLSENLKLNLIFKSIITDNDESKRTMYHVNEKWRSACTELLEILNNILSE